MAVVHTEYVNSAGNDYGTYILEESSANPTQGVVSVNSGTPANITQIKIFDTDNNGDDNRLPYQVLTNGVFSNNEYFLVLSNTSGLDPDIGSTSEFTRYNLSKAVFGDDVLTLNISRIDGEGTNLSYDSTVYVRIYSDIADSSSIELARTESELSNTELFTLRITVLG